MVYTIVRISIDKGPSEYPFHRHLNIWVSNNTRYCVVFFFHGKRMCQAVAFAKSGNGYEYIKEKDNFAGLVVVVWQGW